MAAAAAAWLDALVAAATVGGTSGSSTTVVSICVFTAVLCLCLVAGHLLEDNKWVNESITALIIVRTKAPPSLFFHSLLIHSLFFFGQELLVFLNDLHNFTYLFILAGMPHWSDYFSAHQREALAHHAVR
jgi:hypothetical protein